MIYLTDREVAERYGVSRVTVWWWATTILTGTVRQVGRRRQP